MSSKSNGGSPASGSESGNADLALSHERRTRPRRVSTDLRSEVEQMLLRVEPELQDEVQVLIDAGRLPEAKDKLLEYIVLGDRSEDVQAVYRKRFQRVEAIMSRRISLLSVIPVLIVFYCIWCLLTKGHVILPHWFCGGGCEEG